MKRSLLLVVVLPLALALLGACKQPADQSSKAATGEFMMNAAEYKATLVADNQMRATEKSGKRCHLEYRNCWEDIEYRCLAPSYPGENRCVEVKVRRCDRGTTVCD